MAVFLARKTRRAAVVKRNSRFPLMKRNQKSQLLLLWSSETAHELVLLVRVGYSTVKVPSLAIPDDAICLDIVVRMPEITKKQQFS